MSDIYSYNLVVLVGQMVKIDKEDTMKSQGGRKYLRFRLATNEIYPDTTGRGNPKKHSEYHTVNCYGRLAEIISKFGKPGTFMVVVGKNRQKSFKDREGGSRYFHFVAAEQICFLPRAKSIEEYSEQFPEKEPEPEEGDPY